MSLAQATDLVGPVRPLIGFGQVRHTRLRPARHAFAYPSYFWMLPLRALARQPVDAVRRNARGWLSFHDADHGAGGPDALAWLDGLLREAGAWDEALTRGEVWLQTYPRVLGYAFKPVSFWYVHRADGVLHAIVAEVNNTFGERHCYLLQGPSLGWGSEQQAAKVFHVSPFCALGGQYRFRFLRTRDRVVARVDHDDAHGPLIETALSGALEPLTPRAVRRAIWRWPLMTWGVVARIHWQALKLWLKRVPFHTKPAHPPADFVSGSPAPSPQGPRTP
ncbi:DUF1365 domain-containing protein [Aquabacterium olei]|uniref:DUF1365 domain-containing protein n=1 Tax=Aquabacterium olei TaxID=1296669 RepID=A0A2U8FUW8_9BURK|nr:DUF1365 domain-containing protein [Aquabacterium olei]AWI54862.1 DUF1365 domain-containing protein [Aquabacterium olei]